MKRLVWMAAVVLLLVGACSSDDESSDAASAPDDSVAETGAPPDEPSTPVDQASPTGANGGKVDAAGDLWIAVLADDEVLHVDAESGEVLQRFATPEGSGPDDVVLGDEGQVFWTGYGDGSVGVISPGDGDDAVSVLADVGEGANPIAVRGDGRLVVGRAVIASGLFVLDPEPGAIPEPIDDPGAINSFDISPDDVLYGPLPGPDAGVVAVDPATGEVLERYPVPGAAFGVRWHDGRLYVLTLADAVASVVTVDLDTGDVAPFGQTDLGVADNLAVAEDSTVYVTGFDRPLVAVLDPQGAQVETLTIGG